MKTLSKIFKRTLNRQQCIEHETMKEQRDGNGILLYSTYVRLKTGDIT